MNINNIKDDNALNTPNSTIPNSVSIETPTGMNTFQKVPLNRRARLQHALKAIRTGTENLGDIIGSWRDLSHRSRGIGAKKYTLPIEIRSTSLTRLDQAVQQFNAHEWASNSERLTALIKLRDAANTHLARSSQRTQATEILLKHLNKHINEETQTITTTTISDQEIITDLQSNNAKLLTHLIATQPESLEQIAQVDRASDQSKSIESILKVSVQSRKISISDASTFLKYRYPTTYEQRIAGLVLDQIETNQRFETLTEFAKEAQSVISGKVISQLFEQISRNLHDELFEESIRLNPFQDHTIFKGNNSFQKTTAAILTQIISESSSADHLLSAIAKSSDQPLSELKSSPEEVQECVTEIMANGSDEWLAILHDIPSYQSLANKHYFQECLIAAGVPEITNQVQLLREMETDQLTEMSHREIALTKLTSTDIDFGAIQHQLKYELKILSRTDQYFCVTPRLVQQIEQLKSRTMADRYTECDIILDEPIFQSLDPLQKQQLKQSMITLASTECHISDVEANIQAETSTELQTSTDLKRPRYYANELFRNNRHICLRDTSGGIITHHHKPPNLHTYQLLSALITNDSTITDKDPVIESLKNACFPSDDTISFSIDSLTEWFRQIPLTSDTMRTLQLITQSTVAPVLHHMIHNFGDIYPELPIENNQERTIVITIDPNTVGTATVEWQNSFNYFDSIAAIEANTPATTIVSSNSTTIQCATNTVDTSFQIKHATGTLSEACTAKVTAWKGEIIDQASSQPTKPQIGSLPEPLDAAFTKLSEQITACLAHPYKTKTAATCRLITKIIDDCNAAEISQSTRFNCYKKLNDTLNTLSQRVIAARQHGEYNGIQLSTIFRPQSEQRDQRYLTMINTINQTKATLKDAMISGGKKIAKSATQPYTIIEGNQGQQFELLNSVTPEDATAFELNAFFHPEASRKDGVGKLFIDRGAQKKVRLARNMATNEIVACAKVLAMSETELSELKLEINNQLSLSSNKHTLQLQDHAIIPMGDPDEYKGYLFMSLGKTSGSSAYKQIPTLPTEIEKIEAFSRIAMQLTESIGSLENSGQIHQDIKPHNALLTNQDEWKLIDFGTLLSTDQLQSTTKTEQYNDWSKKGTLEYLSPDCLTDEYFEHNESILKKDAWALGVSLYQLYTGQLPFDLESLPEFSSLEDYQHQIMATPLNTSQIPQPFQSCINGLLNTKPSERLSVKEAHQLLIQGSVPGAT